MRYLSGRWNMAAWEQNNISMCMRDTADTFLLLVWNLFWDLVTLLWVKWYNWDFRQISCMYFWNKYLWFKTSLWNYFKNCKKLYSDCSKLGLNWSIKHVLVRIDEKNRGWFFYVVLSFSNSNAAEILWEQVMGLACSVCLCGFALYFLGGSSWPWSCM